MPLLKCLIHSGDPFCLLNICVAIVDELELVRKGLNPNILLKVDDGVDDCEDEVFYLDR
jgi:hypothetical protein